MTFIIFQFRDVAQVAIIHKMIQPDLRIREYENLKNLASFYIFLATCWNLG
jgi:hypothetical protein